MEKEETEKGTSKPRFLAVVLNPLKQLTVEPYVLLCLFGYTVRLVSFQSLLMESACRNFFQFNASICEDLDNNKKQQGISIEAGNNLYLGVTLLGSLPAVVVAIFLGPWSDKYTRKYPMLISASGMLIEAICSSILTIFPSVSPVWYVVVAIFSGLSGGLMISMSSAFSYISDITDERSRPARFAVMEFFNITAIIFGNAIGGQVYQKFGYLAVLSIAPCSFLCALLYTGFVVKETKPPVPAEQRLSMLRDLFRLDNIKQSYITCSKKRPGNLKLQIWLLIFISCCHRFTVLGTASAAFPFARLMYDWGVTDFSNANIGFSVTSALVTILLMPFLSNKLQLHEAAIGLIGILSLMSRMIITSVASKEFLFFFAFLTGTMANGAGIAVKSRLSKLVQKSELGRAFSLLGTCESVTPVLGSTVFLQVFNASSKFFPGLPFLAAAVFLLLPCAIIFGWMTTMPTFSLAQYAKEEENKNTTAMIEIASPTYEKLEEEKH